MIIFKNLFKSFYTQMTTKIILSDTAEIIIAQLFALILIIVIFRLIIYMNRTKYTTEKIISHFTRYERKHDKEVEKFHDNLNYDSDKIELLSQIGRAP